MSLIRPESSPPRPLINVSLDEFCASVFHDPIENAYPLWESVPAFVRLSERKLRTRSWGKPSLGYSANVSFTCSSFSSANGASLRDRFAALHFVVLDRTLKCCLPTWEMEIAPGVSQAGYVLKRSDRQYRRVNSILLRAQESGLVDGNARLDRFAFAPQFIVGDAAKLVNDLSGLGAGLVQWNPDIQYSSDDIEYAMELELGATNPRSARSMHNAMREHGIPSGVLNRASNLL